MGSVEEDRQFWERAAPHFDRTAKTFARPLARARALAAQGVSGAGSVLEVAAGTGLFTAAIAPKARRVVATDYADAMVTALRRRIDEAGLSNVECARADIYALPFADGSFDAVVASNVLHLVHDLPGAFRALRRVLKPGGILIAPTFCHDETRLSWLLSRMMAITPHPCSSRFTAISLKRAIEGAGFRVRRFETIPGMFPIGYVEGELVDPGV